MSTALSLSTEITELINSLKTEFDQISEDRKSELRTLGGMITSQIKEHGTAKVTFVCTHNSRRSTLSEIWLRLAAAHYEMRTITSFSGGTESTAFNHRMVAAVKAAGIGLTTVKEDKVNPTYKLNLDTSAGDQGLMFSKKYDHEYNPSENFIAVMVCDHADHNCPIVSGASYRMPLTYLDPKASDDTPQEAQAYGDKVREIGREILYMVDYISVSDSVR